MSALVALGLRLARAGGPLRACSISLGNAVGVVLLLVAAALPAAIYPDADQRVAERVQVMGVLVFLLVPAVVLLVTVGRLSSGLRDRRLAALRMLGVSRGKVRVAAAVENGALALVGALAGGAVFAVAAPTIGPAEAGGPSWLAGSLRVAPLTAVSIMLGVIALSVVVGTAATWDRALPGAARTEAVRRVPRPWRLAVLAMGLAALTTVARLDLDRAPDDVEGTLFFGGALVTAVGIALVTPLVTAWLAHGLVRGRSVGALLAGRAIQTDPAGAARVVAGLGVALFLTVGALGVLAANAAFPQNRLATQTLTTGPQTIRVDTGPWDAHMTTFSPDDLASLAGVPGVLGVVPRHSASVTVGDVGQLSAFVGTCAELALVAEVTGCDDSRAAWIVSSREPTGSARWVWQDYDYEADFAANEEILTWAYDEDDAESVRALDLSGPRIVQDVDRQTERWVYRAYQVAFVPLAQVADLVGRPSTVDAVAVGGVEVQHAVAAWAEQHGFIASALPRDDYDKLQGLRTALLTLCGVAVGIGLLILALTATDRAAERRRSVARLVAVGVPPRVLRTGQLVQTLLPTAVAALLALGSGLVAHAAFVNEAQLQTSVQATTLLDVRSWVVLVAAVATGMALVGMATVPLIRTRLTADLLRRE